MNIVMFIIHGEPYLIFRFNLLKSICSRKSDHIYTSFIFKSLYYNCQKFNNKLYQPKAVWLMFSEQLFFYANEKQSKYDFWE